MKKNIIFSLIGIFLFGVQSLTSCTNRIDELYKELNDLYSNTIEIPYSDMDAVVIDSIISPQNANFKILVYLDSLECTSCNANHHQEWELMIKECKEIEPSIALTFVIEKRNISDNVMREYKRSCFDKSVFHDKKGEFRRKNAFLPSSNMMHVLLLDKNNKVLLVGNPLKNFKIKELYFNYIKIAAQNANSEDRYSN